MRRDLHVLRAAGERFCHGTAMTTSQSDHTPPPALLHRITAPALATRLQPGRAPSLLFLPGFRSSMLGEKARAVAAWGQHMGLCVARFDYSGFGESQGAWSDVLFGHWVNDALAVLDSLPQGPVILVGSSMGAWVAVRAAMARPLRVAGLLTIAAAPDFSDTLLPQRFAAAGGGDFYAHMQRFGALDVPSNYGDGPYRISRAFFEDSLRYRVLVQPPLPCAVPVRMLHGTGDVDVPWSLSVRLMEALSSADAHLTLVKGGDHRLSQPDHLQLLRATLESLVARVS
jgi:pimeloyl-ACP methyl ester carboxylesterase